MYSKFKSVVLLAIFFTLPSLVGAAQIPDFSGQEAMEFLVTQCELGPRIPGSEANLALRNLIVSKARKLKLSVTVHAFQTEMPMGNSPVELGNIIVSAGERDFSPGTRFWLGAHYDTRPISDRDPDPGNHSKSIDGANDGASGVAVLWHLMDILAENPPSMGVDLLFFDGEDSGTSGQLNSFCIGSQKLASTMGDFDNPLEAASCRGLIVLDMIGDKDLFVPMEGYSLRNAPEFTRFIFQRAVNLGLPGFSMTPGRAVFDDHVPFLQQGIPAVDLIDFDYSVWHTQGDVPSACSPASLQQVGDLLIDVIYRP
ncbi:MAG: M28 family peptidase [bacterium]|nr:M28 family peptidase [bacterium]